MANDQVSVEISIEEKAALRALTELSKGIDGFEKDATKAVKNADSRFNTFVGNLQANAASFAIGKIVDGFTELAAGSLEAAATTEKLATQFEVLTGNQDTAIALFEELKAFSATTPFQLTNIAEASSQLLSFGFEAETVTERIEKIGEVAAGSGSDLKEVALIYGQVAAAGKLTGERLLQLQERAIPIGAALANSLGVAESEVRDLVSSGVVGFKEFEQAFNSMSQSGGIFEGAIDKQSQTINGVLSTLQDNFSLLQAEIGRAFSPTLIAGAQSLTKALQSIQPVATDVANTFGALTNFLTADDGVPKARAEIKALQATLTDVKNTTDRVNSVLGEDSWLGRLNRSRANERIANINAEIKTLAETLKSEGIDVRAEELASLRGAQEAFEASQAKKVTTTQETNTKLLEERRKLEEALVAQELTFGQAEAERRLAQNELTLEQREVEIQNIRNFETMKAEAAYQAALERNEKIRDADSKRLADQLALSKRSTAISMAEARAEKQIQDQRVRERQQMVSGFQIAFAQASALAKKGTSEQKALASASAIINTYAAATRAYRDYPYPANLAVLATTLATGFQQVRSIQSQSFQNGGVVGGFSGATNGTDNTTANVRTGEMVLNGSQQRRLFDIAAGNENQQTQATNLELTSIIEVDGREIARVVRDQRVEGFV